MKSKRTNADITLNIQYLKDFSFNNLKAPEIYLYNEIKPKVDISFDLNATKLKQDIYESEIILELNGKIKGEIAFILKIIYSGIFTIKNVENSLIPESLFIDCPTILFPFVRQIVASITRDANLPPIMLDIVDFEEVYESKKDSIENIKK